MPGFSKRTRAIITERCGGYCEVCRERPPVDSHHRAPRSMGGGSRAWVDLPSNGLAVCRQCHDRIESHREEAMANGWLVRRNGGDLPEEVPVTDLFGDIRFFTDEGGFVPIYRNAI